MNPLDFDTELRPLLFFVDNFVQEDQKIEDWTETKQDPPDFIITLGGNKINLEVTSIVDSKIYELNNLFSEIDKVCYKSAEKHKHLLPKGKYLFYFFPGDNDIILPKGGTYTVPDFSKKSRRTVRKKEIDKKIELLFRSISNGKGSTVKLHNKKGEVFGRIFFSSKGNHDKVQYFFFPQKISVSSILEKAILEKIIQEAISRKEKNYANRNLDKENEWWLLLSDIDNEMNTGLLNFDLQDLKFKSTFFDRILLIRKPFIDCLIDDLRFER